jgi:hypothetical protein
MRPEAPLLYVVLQVFVDVYFGLFNSSTKNDLGYVV